MVHLGVDETSEWCNSFVLVPKANGKVWLCLDPGGLSKVLIRPVYRDPILNVILLKLGGVKYFTFTGASSGYHYLTWIDKSSYSTTFSCPFGRYRYI